jgi:hypothetical protein
MTAPTTLPLDTKLGTWTWAGNTLTAFVDGADTVRIVKGCGRTWIDDAVTFEIRRRKLEEYGWKRTS